MMSADPTLSNLSVPRLGILESTPTPRGIGSSDSSLEGLVRQAKQGNASDVHLCVGEAPRSNELAQMLRGKVSNRTALGM